MARSVSIGFLGPRELPEAAGIGANELRLSSKRAVVKSRRPRPGSGSQLLLNEGVQRQKKRPRRARGGDGVRSRRETCHPGPPQNPGMRIFQSSRAAAAGRQPPGKRGAAPGGGYGHFRAAWLERYFFFLDDSSGNS
jgi:hypothetical protein